ncbi:hypothetical protein ALC56_13483 [Trachymyrmex septentrionalis]|uniref:Uncharacterized protein n=1 Tax=Trachymyrmex septentrionalis TaxID=34720 RepID=A0A195EV16_9HYME|nr:hypothetical protein ALC56_13483 [Trachymyrmex septentrionalis]
MEADIYPRQCVTGSAKSAMMNVLAGINPQCTPPPPSSSTVPPPPTAATSHDPLIFGQVTMITGPAPSKGFHGEPVRYKHVGVFHGIQIRRPRASYS